MGYARQSSWPVSLQGFFTFDLCYLLLLILGVHCYIVLFTPIVVTWTSWFSRHKFKLEAKDFIFHILQINFPNFGVKMLVLCSAKSLWSFYFPLFCCQLVCTCSKYEVVQSLVKTFPKQIFFCFYSQVAYNCSNYKQNKTSIQIFQILLTNKAPLALIFFRELHITCKTYYNLSIKGKNYKLD